MNKVAILPGIDPKKYFPDARYVLLYGFSVGDRHYFRFDDPLSMGYDRALKTLVYYKEIDMNVDRALIKAHTEAFTNVLMKPAITIDTLIELKKLNDQLAARLELPKEPDLVYKLASIVFFDQFENPNIYEFKYGEGKIRYWKKNTDIKDFFLQTPIRELIPYLPYAAENLETFSRMITSETADYLDNLSKLLSPEQKQILKDKFNLSPAA